MFSQAPLPYTFDALEPHISSHTMELHYGKHHKGYVDKLNAEIEESKRWTDGDADLVDILQNSDGHLFNMAAQVWNHAFFWQCMTPNGGGEPSTVVEEALQSNFGSTGKFLDRFKEAASSEFGSGWAWLCHKKDGSLTILSTTDAETPLERGLTPLLTLDVWEHAYYLDYQNKRPDYIDAFCEHLINWKFVERNLTSALQENRAA